MRAFDTVFHSIIPINIATHSDVSEHESDSDEMASVEEEEEEEQSQQEIINIGRSEAYA